MILKKLKNILLLIRCYLKSITKEKVIKSIDNPKKILVIQLAKLGDMVCATPMFKAVKQKYPQSKVYVVGNLINKDLLENNMDVDGYFVFEDNISKDIKKLNEQNFDFACITTPHFNSLVTLYLSNIKLIAAPLVVGGFCPQNTKAFKALLKLVKVIPHQFRNYAPREYLKLLEPIGVQADITKKHLAFSSEGEKKVLDFFTSQSINIQTDFIVGLSPSVGNAIKLWPANRFAKVADYIYKKYQAKIIIFGSKADQEQNEKMIASLDKDTKVIDATNKFNIDKLKATVSKLSLFISVDTGPIYIAEAFNVPTVDIVGPMDDNVQPPKGKFNRIVKVEREKGEIYVMNARVYNKKEAKRQIDEITVDMVIKELDNLIKLIKTK